MINFDYKNKVAVVTGGTSGIGLATVRILLKSGAKVAFCARSRERLLEVESKLKLEFSNDQVFAKALSVLDQNEVNKFSKDNFSYSSTSSPAPSTFFAFIAATRSFVTTDFPLAVFMR